MKKRIWFVLIFALSNIFCACSQEKKEYEGTLIHGFETYEAARKYTYEEWFGKAQVNFDRAYVSEGNASLKVQPTGDFDKKEEYPYFGVNTSDKENVFFSDFSSFSSITLDIFNPNGKAMKIGVCLQAETGAAQAASTPLTYFTASEGVWTRCEYFLTPAMKYAFDNLNSVTRVMVAFTDKKQFAGEENYSLYIDNLRGIAEETENSYEVARSADGVFLNFESPDDKNALDYFWVSKFACFMADSESNVDRRYVYGGNGSLKLTIRNSFVDYSKTNDDAYVGVALTQKILKTALKGADTFSFVVFNDCDTAQTVKVRYYLTAYEDRYYTLPPKEFTMCSVYDENLSGATKITIKFSDEYIESNGGKSKVFYLDEFKALKSKAANGEN